MTRRTKAVLLVGGLAFAAVVVLAVAPVAVLTVALARSLDTHQYCETGFSPLVDCTLHWSTKTVGQSNPIFTSPPGSTGVSSSRSTGLQQPGYVDSTSWAVADCPKNIIARHLLCALPSAATPVEAASDDLASGLPRPKPWLLTTGKNSPFIKSVHVETPLDLAAVLSFYRAELGRRGWLENTGTVIEADRAAIAFTTSEGPALLRLIHQDGRTTADLSRRKPAATNAAILPQPKQARLILGNATDQEAAITINAQVIKLAPRAGMDLRDDAATGRIAPDSAETELPPGQYKVTLKTAGGAAQDRQFEVAADETWGLLVGPGGVPLPVHLY